MRSWVNGGPWYHLLAFKNLSPKVCIRLMSERVCFLSLCVAVCEGSEIPQGDCMVSSVGP